MAGEKNGYTVPKQLRVCQECGYAMWTAPPPAVPASQIRYTTWANAKCRICKSEALNFGNTYAPGDGPKPMKDEDFE